MGLAQVSTFRAREAEAPVTPTLYCNASYRAHRLSVGSAGPPMARILLIEDEDDVRAFVRAILVSLGHRVEEAPDGKAGVEQFLQSQPDLVITDLLMPVMEGLEVMRRVKHASPSIKVIVMTGGGMIPAGEYLRLARRMGADGSLAKPFSACELECAISKLLPGAPASLAKPPTFLILDDDVTSRFLNRSILEKNFPESSVIECGSTDDALAASKGQHLDAVVTDHLLGQSDGVEFVTRLRAQGARCPVIMVTGSVDPAVHKRAYEAGAAHVFFGGDSDFSEYLRKALSPR